MITTELYFSVDVEADGPIPSLYSMLSIGVCVAGRKSEGGPFIGMDPDAYEWYAELKPIPDATFIPEALAVSGLDRTKLIKEGEDPFLAMLQLNRWVLDTAAKFDARPIFVAYPLGFDWSFVHWYFMAYNKSDPFGFSNAIDIKTMFMTQSRNLLTKSTKKNMPKELGSKRKHTHNALDDAKGQADLFANLMVVR